MSLAPTRAVRRLLTAGERTLLDALHDAVVAYDGDGTIVYANPAMAELVALEPGSAEGERYTTLVTASAKSSDGPVVKAVVLGRGGRLIDVDVRVSPVPESALTIAVIRPVAATDGASPSSGEPAQAAPLAAAIGAAPDGQRAPGAPVTEESHERLTRLARTLQQTLLPPELPRVPNLELAALYHPAGRGADIGGDFYDVFPIRRDSWGVVIGDVCGKGPEAAVVTALARYTIRGAAMQARRPSDALVLLNDAIIRQRELASSVTERFVTLALGTLRRVRDGYAVTLSLAGHLRPIVLRADGSVHRVGILGTLAGILDDVEMADDHFLLERGDALVLFTDGVTEGRGARARFGEARLERLVARAAGLDAHAMADRVAQAALRYQDGEPCDDLAVVVARVPAGAAPA